VRIVQLTTTPCAYYPHRIAACINKYSNHSSRCVEVKHDGHFKHDLTFAKDKDECIELLNSADVIHMHNYLTLDSGNFSPVNLRKLYEKGTKFVIHYHSAPDIIMKVCPTRTIESILYPEIPSIVSAQMQSRYYPNSYVVPQVIPFDDEEYRNKGYLYDVVYFASNKISLENRFDSKGWTEVCSMLDATGSSNILKSACFEYDFNKCMDMKSRSLVVIDDLFSGTYHLNALEALAMSKAVMCYVDNYSEAVLKFITGATWIPFVNVHYNDSLEVVKWLIDNRAKAVEIGKSGREWIEKYYSPKAMINKWYIPMYKSLFDNPARIKRQKGLDNVPFMYKEFNDLMHGMRHKRLRSYT